MEIGVTPNLMLDVSPLQSKHSIEGYKIKFVPLPLNLNINIMYSSEDLEIKCKSNTMKLASFVEMQPLLYKDFISSIKPRRCLMANRYRVFV